MIVGLTWYQVQFKSRICTVRVNLLVRIHHKNDNMPGIYRTYAQVYIFPSRMRRLFPVGSNPSPRCRPHNPPTECRPPRGSKKTRSPCPNPPNLLQLQVIQFLPRGEAIPVVGAPAPAPMEGVSQAAGGMRRVSTANMTDIARQLFVASPAYPSGVGGVITSSRSTGAWAPSPSLPVSSSGRETGKQSFKMVFDKTLPVTPGREEATVEMLPVGLEAVCDENGGAISIRELLPSGSGGVGAEGPGGVIARIEALRSAGGARGTVYSVILGEDGGAAEVMAARVSSHPTRLAAPREVRAVLLLPPSHQEDSDGRGSEGGKSE